MKNTNSVFNAKSCNFFRYEGKEGALCSEFHQNVSKNNRKSRAVFRKEKILNIEANESRKARFKYNKTKLSNNIQKLSNTTKPRFVMAPSMEIRLNKSAPLMKNLWEGVDRNWTGNWKSRTGVWEIMKNILMNCYKNENK